MEQLRLWKKLGECDLFRKDKRSKYMNDLQLLDFVFLALQDPHTKDLESLIERACQYGKSYEITPEEVERVVNKKLIDFI